MVPYALGQEVKFLKDQGPILDNFSKEKFFNNNEKEFSKKLEPVYKAIEITRSNLSKEKSLISFVGAPWTLLIYMMDIKNKKKAFFFKKYISNFEELGITNNSNAAIIIPDKDIIPGSETFSPAFIVFENYEKILNWNRSLRFALAVCTLKDKFKNEL